MISKIIPSFNIKPIINTVLKPFNLHLLRTNSYYAGGIDLFSDLKRIIKVDNPLCIDVGANTGQTIDLLLKTFTRSQIYSFEPSTEAFTILQQKYLKQQPKFNVKSNIKLYNLALGSSPNVSEIINYDNSCMNSFLPLNSNKDENVMYYFSEIKKELATIETLDNWLIQNEINHIHLLKIDTQGYDFEVLKGSQCFLQRGLIDCISVEINFIQMYEGQGQAGDILNYLQHYNMVLVDYYEKIRVKNRLAWCTALFVRNN